jgi:hypothetical protein
LSFTIKETLTFFIRFQLKSNGGAVWCMDEKLASQSVNSLTIVLYVITSN